MNQNGTTLTIIFIYLVLMTSLPLLKNGSGSGRSCQILVYATSAAADRGKVNLYSRFQDRLNAASNLAESEYESRTSDALKSIYSLTGDIPSQDLEHQHQEERTESDSPNGNYADRLLDEGEGDEHLFAPREDAPSPAVASSNTYSYTPAAALNGSTIIVAANNNRNAILAEKNLQLINSSVIVSNADQSNHRQARKIQKASRILRHSPLPRPGTRRRSHRRRLKEFHPRTNTGRRQSSRPSMALSLDAGLRKLSTSQYQKRAYATLKQQQQAAKNIDDCSRCSRNRSIPVLDAGSGHKMNSLAMERIATESGCGGDGDDGSKIGDDDSTKPFGRSSVKWRKKLQIDGNKNNLRKTRSWPIIPFAKDQSNGLIQSSGVVDEEENGKIEKNENENENEEDEDEIRQQQISSRNSYSLCDDDDDDGRRRRRIHTRKRNTDSFPEVFARPLVESSSAPIITGTGSGNELNEAIKNANSLLTTAQDVARNSGTPFVKLDDSRQRIGKQIQTLSDATLNGANTGLQNYPTSDGSATNLTNVMEKVLDELETLKECKSSSEGTQPEGSPCDVIGSWNSETIGLQFHISMANPSTSSRTFAEGKTIDIELTERVPPRRHDLMECDWFITGNTVKQVGGPFYMAAQKADRFIVATFAGLCKTCGGIPTIFGSWTFVYPAKDCQDISLSVENKRDILRRDTLEAKRKHRRDRFRSKDKGKCSHGLF